MKFKSKSNSALIEPGNHLAVIKQVYTDKASTGNEQLAVEFEADGKKITRWYNLKGFKVSADSPTIKDASGRTVPDPHRALDARRTFAPQPAQGVSAEQRVSRAVLDCVGGH